jgi:hypothetical protein
MTEKHDYKRFKPSEIARSFPATAETLLMDTYLTNEPAPSSRVFRVYRELPSHYHAGRDEYLYVLGEVSSGWTTPRTEGTSLLATSSSSNAELFMLCPKFLRGRVFLSFDTPRRDPEDIIFVNPKDGTPESFVRRKEQ